MQGEEAERESALESVNRESRRQTYCFRFQLFLIPVALHDFVEVRFHHQAADDDLVQNEMDLMRAEVIGGLLLPAHLGHVEDNVQLADGIKASVHCFDEYLPKKQVANQSSYIRLRLVPESDRVLLARFRSYRHRRRCRVSHTVGTSAAGRWPVGSRFGGVRFDDWHSEIWTIG